MSNAIYTHVAQHKNNILLRGYDERGKRIQRKVSFKPYLFLTDGNNQTETKYRTLIGDQPAHRVDFGNIYEAREFIKNYAGVSSMKIHGLTRWPYVFINDNYPGFELAANMEWLKIAFLDIEVRSNEGFPKPSSAAQEITAITLYDGKVYHVFGMKDYKPHKEGIEYHRYENEHSMLSAFCVWFSHQDFDVITGWNVEAFDMPYLVRRIINVLGEVYAKELSPWEKIEWREFHDRNGRENEGVDLLGISTLDFYQLYLKFHPGKQESYKLGYIASVELDGVTKVDYSEYGDLEGLYQQNPQLYFEYNIKDVELVVDLEKKLKYIELAIAIAYDAKINYKDATTSVLLWDMIIHNRLMAKNIVVPHVEEPARKSSQVAGAYVKETKIGRYRWGVGFDLDSLYPHIIMGWNISPETFYGVFPGITPEFILNEKEKFEKIREKLLEQNLTICGNGAIFRRDKQGILPELMDLYYKDRKRYKNKMLEMESKVEANPSDKESKALAIQYKNIQNAKKISLNSCYGALLNKYFRYYNDALGEGVTLSGQVVIQSVSKSLNDYLTSITGINKDYIIYNDTDSAGVDMQLLVNMRWPDGMPTDKMEIVSFLDKMASYKIQPVIDQCFKDLAVYMNCFEQRMRMKREAIFESAIWTGAKHYAMLVWDSEGVTYRNKKTGLPEPKMKVVGIESVRSTTPNICRGAIDVGLRMVLDEQQDKLYSYVEQFKNEFESAPVSMIARSSSVKNLDHYARQADRLPPHVAGSLLYNRIIQNKGLVDKYQRIMDGDRIKFVQLKSPNPYNAKWIAFPDDSIPEEFGLERYIDKDAQLEVGFMSVLRSIADAGSMELEKKSNLMDFFN